MANNPLEKIDTKEIELPETVYIHDIETKVFQLIVIQCLLKIPDISILGGNIIDSLFGREPSARISGVTVEQDQKSHSINVKLEVNVAYGVCIPKKAEEIQTLTSKELTSLTGLHVGVVHVVFKNLITPSSHQSEGYQEKIQNHQVPSTDTEFS